MKPVLMFLLIYHIAGDVLTTGWSNLKWFYIITASIYTAVGCAMIIIESLQMVQDEYIITMYSGYWGGIVASFYLFSIFKQN